MNYHYTRISTARRAQSAPVAMLCTLLLFFSPQVDAEPANSSGVGQQHSFPPISLESEVRGLEAIALLGNSLDELAEYYGKSTAEFSRLLREDSNLWLDRDGRAFYQDRFSAPGTHSDAWANQPAPFPIRDTFTLESRPGAERVIYLDFSGNTTRNTAFNRQHQLQSIESPAYSRDTDQAFSSDELRRIQIIWQQVAEDFSPFDVNVTTRFPGDSKMNRRAAQDESYGTRVVISTEPLGDCDCDGISYLGAFDDIGSSRKPVFVFSKTGDISGADISHQLRHSLGLHHDSKVLDPHPSFADDLRHMQASGLSLLPDDHADTHDGATSLASSSEDSIVRLFGSGLIGRDGDIDVFRFYSGEGSFSIEVNPLASTASLDIEIEIHDVNGDLVASANPGHSPAAVIGGRLRAGSYYLRVNGADTIPSGSVANTGYRGLGRYSVGGIVAHPGSQGTPQALAVADYEAGLAPMPVKFDGEVYNQRDSNIVSWHWDFGDGHSSSSENAVHTYGSPGTYTATLTVTDNRGRSDSDSVVVAVDGLGTGEHAQDRALAATDSPW